MTDPGLALSSDPGSNRSISLGDCPEKLGLAVFGGALVLSSNKLDKLLVTVSAANLGCVRSLIYGGVLMSNMGG